MAIVLSIHTGKPEPVRGKPERRSAIRKTPVAGPIALAKYGLPGDNVVDLRYHGGPFKALCVYASEFYALWRERFDATMPPGSFGENLHIAGLPDDQVCLGDIYAIGPARVEVAGPRGPCGTLAAHWNVKDFQLTIKRERKTGFYLSVREPGTIEAGMEMTLLERPLPHWSLVRFWDVLESKATPAAQVEELLALDSLDDDWKPKLKAKLRQAGED